MASPSALRAAGVYRVPYVNGTTVRVSHDEGSHFPPNKYDFNGACGTGPYRVAAAAAGIVRHIQDGFDENRQNGNPCNNNYVWIEHPNGEWSKYTHMRQGTVRGDAGLSEDTSVVAGQCLGLEGKVGCAHGQHLHFEVAVPIDPDDAVDDDGDIIGGHQRNRIPWICGIDGRRFVDGQTVTAGPCPSVDISALPALVRFARVPIGQGATQICTVVNLGRKDATVQVAASPGGSVLAWFPVEKTLARGEFVDVPIRFTPTSVLPAQATMVVTIEGERSLRVGVMGTGTGPSQSRPRVVAEPASIRFDPVAIDDDATTTCTLVNRGDRSATVDVDDPPIGSSFRWFRLHATLDPGESVAVPIRFTPTRIGTARVTLHVSVTGSEPIEVDITGDGELAGPLIRLEPSGSLSFGQVLLGRSATRELRLVNTSSEKPVTLNIDAAPSGPIRWSAVSAMIPPEGSRTVSVTFRPTELGRVPATMSIGVTAPIAHVVRLSIDGTGTGGSEVP
jgi:murein DD-endopeptidase MepM/ murein hydrolase activator NlpD